MARTPAPIDHHLQECRDWAKAKLKTRKEPPWSWYQLMKLIETIDAILEGRSVKKAGSQESDQRRETSLRLVDSDDPQDTAPRLPEKIRVHLPM